MLAPAPFRCKSPFNFLDLCTRIPYGVQPRAMRGCQALNDAYIKRTRSSHAGRPDAWKPSKIHTASVRLVATANGRYPASYVPTHPICVINLNSIFAPLALCRADFPFFLFLFYSALLPCSSLLPTAVGLAQRLRRLATRPLQRLPRNLLPPAEALVLLCQRTSVSDA